MSTKCDNCVKINKELKTLTEENYKLQKLIAYITEELHNKRELIKEIKEELAEMHMDKSHEDIIFKLISKLNK